VTGCQAQCLHCAGAGRKTLAFTHAAENCGHVSWNLINPSLEDGPFLSGTPCLPF
jgi:hypothetical protein